MAVVSTFVVSLRIAQKPCSHEIRGGIWRRHDHGGTEDGEIPIRLASSDMISASHANYHSQTRARSQLPTDLPDVEQLLRNRPPRKVAKFSSGIPESDFESDAVAAYSAPRLVSRKG